MELMAIGFLFGVVIVLLVLLFWLEGRLKDVEKTLDCDVRIYVPTKRREKTDEETLDSRGSSFI